MAFLMEHQIIYYPADKDKTSFNDTLNRAIKLGMQSLNPKSDLMVKSCIKSKNLIMFSF